MSDASPPGQPSPQQPSDAPTKAKAGGGSIVVKIVLIVVLIAAVGGVVYEFAVASPQSNAAYEKLDAMMAEKKYPSQEEVREAIGKDPSETREVEGRTVETYSWRRGLLINSHELHVVYQAGRAHTISFNQPPNLKPGS